jgi:N-acetylglucosaminyl-diphospho-decaprenol L-rhamnosyltransferase
VTIRREEQDAGMDQDGGGTLAQRLTIVLLTHNCVGRVATVLQHLRDLGVPLVVVDNASRDGTLHVLRGAAQAGVDLLALPTNIGAAARNAGAERARTPYVAFCDDDGWYDLDGLETACDLLDAHPDLGLINARILVGDAGWLDPICAEMEQSPLTDHAGLPGKVLLGFMAGACVVRRSAYLDVGGYDHRFFIGGEEEHLAMALARAGWQMRYIPAVVMRHYPSLANFTRLRGYGMRNTLWTAWLHRRLTNALRYTWFTLLDAPKDGSYLHGLTMALRGLPWVIRERRPMSRRLDAELRLLDARRYAARRPVLTFRHPGASSPSSWAPQPTRPAGPVQETAAADDPRAFEEAHR